MKRKADTTDTTLQGPSKRPRPQKLSTKKRKAGTLRDPSKRYKKTNHDFNNHRDIETKDKLNESIPEPRFSEEPQNPFEPGAGQTPIAKSNILLTLPNELLYINCSYLPSESLLNLARTSGDFQDIVGGSFVSPDTLETARKRRYKSGDTYSGKKRKAGNPTKQQDESEDALRRRDTYSWPGYDTSKLKRKHKAGDTDGRKNRRVGGSIQDIYCCKKRRVGDRTQQHEDDVLGYGNTRSRMPTVGRNENTILPPHQCSLLRLPNEILLLIVKGLPISDMLGFMKVNKRLWGLVTLQLPGLVKEFLLGRRADVTRVSNSSHRTVIHAAGMAGLGKLLRQQMDCIARALLNKAKVIGTGFDDKVKQLFEDKLIDIEKAPFSVTGLEFGEIIKRLLNDKYLNMEENFSAEFRDTAKHLLREKRAVMQKVLSSAVEAGFGDIMKHLLDNEDVDINLRDTSDRTLFLRSSQLGFYKMAELLLNRGADIKSKDHNGETALHGAVRSGSYQTVKFLLSTAIEIEARNNDDSTALHIAARNGEHRIVELLLESGANFKAQDGFEKTALFIAAAQGHGDVVELLLGKGASPRVKAISGITALHATKCDKIARLLGRNTDIYPGRLRNILMDIGKALNNRANSLNPFGVLASRKLRHTYGRIRTLYCRGRTR